MSEQDTQARLLDDHSKIGAPNAHKAGGAPIGCGAKSVGPASCGGGGGSVGGGGVRGTVAGAYAPTWLSSTPRPPAPPATVCVPAMAVGGQPRALPPPLIVSHAVSSAVCVYLLVVVVVVVVVVAVVSDARLLALTAAINL